ncbi:MAG: HEAT repeat domain-containing protein, partial [Bacteroidales bacterium]
MKIKFLMQRMKFIGAIMCVLFISGELQAKNWFSTFAVVVDGVTYSKIKTDVDAYVTSVQTLDRKGVLVIDKWNSPDSLRAVLNKMYKNNNLEGAVFIGDIPVPMIRDA